MNTPSSSPNNRNNEELVTDLLFLQYNNNLNIINYLANKYQLTTNSAKDIIDYLLQFTGDLDKEEPQETYPVELQENFDPARYSGKWYTIARIPHAFDRSTSWETAEYRVLRPGVIEVVNTGYDKNNQVKGQVIGTAEMVNSMNPALRAALYVSFPTSYFVSQTRIPNYLIHQTDYDNFSIVGSYDKKSLYFLGRQRPIARNLYQEMLAYAQDLGYDTNLLVPCDGAIL